MKKIVIALDCTPAAAEVLSAVKANFTEIANYEVVLLHLLLQPDYYISGQYTPILGFNHNYNREVGDLLDSDELETGVREFLTHLKDENGLNNASIEVIPGNPETELGELSGQMGADILVVGRQNPDGRKQNLGHVTQAVLQSANCAVLVAPISIG